MSDAAILQTTPERRLKMGVSNSVFRLLIGDTNRRYHQAVSSRLVRWFKQFKLFKKSSNYNSPGSCSLVDLIAIRMKLFCNVKISVVTLAC